MYEKNADPWNFKTSQYEHAKYQDTIDSLPRKQYQNTLEVGCSNGVLTNQIASVTGRLVSIDVSEVALKDARERNKKHTNITFDKVRYPQNTPKGPFDLIMLSEVVYYWTKEDVALASRQVLSELAPHGDVILVHWLGETDYPLSGDDAVECFIENTKQDLKIVKQKREEKYRLDVFTRK